MVLKFMSLPSICLAALLVFAADVLACFACASCGPPPEPPKWTNFRDAPPAPTKDRRCHSHVKGIFVLRFWSLHWFWAILGFAVVMLAISVILGPWITARIRQAAGWTSAVPPPQPVIRSAPPSNRFKISPNSSPSALPSSTSFKSNRTVGSPATRAPGWSTATPSGPLISSRPASGKSRPVRQILRPHRTAAARCLLGSTRSHPDPHVRPLLEIVDSADASPRSGAR